MLNSLSTLLHLHLLYPTTITNTHCITCNVHESQLHWLTCPTSQILSSVISNTIQQFFNSSHLDIIYIQLQNLYTELNNYSCLFLNFITNNNINIYSTIYRFVLNTLILTIQKYTNTNQTTTDITIKFLIQLSQNIYNQIWKPYCTKLANWKQQHNISTRPTHIQTNSHNNSNNTEHIHYPRSLYTYNCICGLADQQHVGDEHNICPPIGMAKKKTSIWISEWIKYSTPTNNIINYQITNTLTNRI